MVVWALVGTDAQKGGTASHNNATVVKHKLIQTETGANNVISLDSSTIQCIEQDPCMRDGMWDFVCAGDDVVFTDSNKLPVDVNAACGLSIISETAPRNHHVSCKDNDGDVQDGKRRCFGA